MAANARTIRDTSRGITFDATQDNSSPVWSPGGDRGLYKTTDGGKTWNAVLTIDENTGVTDFVMDPRDPDIQANLRFARTLVQGGTPASATLGLRIPPRLTLNQWTELSAALLWAFAAGIF